MIENTYVEFDKQLMGPILDNKGLEQGGISSSDEYKIYNNEQANTAQLSGLGVPLKDKCISSILLADDSVLLSNDILSLHHLLYLTIQYCKKYKVELVPDKTKLLAFTNNKQDPDIEYAKLISQISLNGQQLPFSEEVEHLGILRTTTPGNIESITERLSAYNKKLFSLLPAGLARHHQANTEACLRVEQLYALPVLMYGLSALVLNKSEVNIISSCHKNNLQRLMKLHEKTPDCVIYFLAGSLPCAAILHLRQLSLFRMICHLKDDILNSLAIKLLVHAKPGAHSWF